jgi:serine/threonine protein kinase
MLQKHDLRLINPALALIKQRKPFKTWLVREGSERAKVIQRRLRQSFMLTSVENLWPASLQDRFIAVKELGAGGQSTVFLVRERGADAREFALKILETSTINAINIARFKDEFAILRDLDNPFIIKAYELINLGETPAILMEAVKGKNLLEVIQEQKLNTPEIEKIFSGILMGLDALHSRSLAHRDLKLENVIIDKNYNPKLIDLGFLKRVGGLESENLENLLGTIQYLAPEYIKHNHYDFKSDLYSVALMLYECLTGRRWLAGKTPEQSLQYLYEINFEFPRLALAGLPVKFQEVIERGLSIQPRKRFDSAKAMRLAILSENGSEKPFQQVSVQENVNIQLVNSRRKTQEFLSDKRKAHNRIMLIILLIVLSALAFSASTLIMTFKNHKTSQAEAIKEEEQIHSQEVYEHSDNEGNISNQEVDIFDVEAEKKDDTWLEFDERHMLQ